MSRLSMRPSPLRWEALETATRRCPAVGCPATTATGAPS